MALGFHSITGETTVWASAGTERQRYLTEDELSLLKSDKFLWLHNVRRFD